MTEEVGRSLLVYCCQLTNVTRHTSHLTRHTSHEHTNPFTSRTSRVTHPPRPIASSLTSTHAARPPLPFPLVSPRRMRDRL